MENVNSNNIHMKCSINQHEIVYRNIGVNSTYSVECADEHLLYEFALAV